ncbi:hypothetical protein FLL45_13920 [Aliikangiella marina]|uniref:Uncharacterized protein n=1 Tax=Aliikangiella marina TaxID=1712262 RepID=A0A545T9R8_9GAMM|nr:hypothetical protein [Aliikangiella marina]TQV73955.1 hypothetical protein FLL45_13920 [Aliikangiella marina]
MKERIIRFEAPKNNQKIRENASHQDEIHSVYMGEERRNERRRGHQNQRVEVMLKNFGLDRRLRQERRNANSSWLLTSSKVANLK